MDRRKSPSRAGFTLVEVLVAILIIALLIAILLPAIRGAFRKAQEAQVSAELNNLATALASFKNTYGDYPPSRIILCEMGFNSIAASNAPAGPISPSGNDTDLTVTQLVQRSRLYLRRFWPRADFDSDPTRGGLINPVPGGFHDFDGNKILNPKYIILSGSECLAFFLGGIPTHDGTGFVTGVSGFSKLPLYPFVDNATVTNRTIPNYDFNAGRLVDLDGDLMPSYLDPLDSSPSNRRSYAYFSAYGSNSYDPNDVNGLGKTFDLFDPTHDFEEEDQFDSNPPPYVERGFAVTFPTTSTIANYAISPGPNPYCTTLPVQFDSNNHIVGVVAWINPNSFQLFSAGQDRNWGLGGQYLQNNFGSTGRLAVSPTDAGIINKSTSQPTWNDYSNGIRNRESDNLTNFSGGRLD